MKVQIKALHAFSHGALLTVPDGEYTINKGEADELVKAGLVEILPAEAEAPQTGVTDSQPLTLHVERSETPIVTDSKPADDDADDLVGLKAEPAPQNKMEAAPANKGKKK